MLMIVILAFLPIVVLVVATMFFVNELNKADERFNTLLAEQLSDRRPSREADVASDRIVLYEVRRPIDRAS
jgi:hypothetical protein